MRNHGDVNEALPMAMQEGWHEEVDVLFRFKIIISNNRYCHRIRKKSFCFMMMRSMSLNQWQCKREGMRRWMFCLDLKSVSATDNRCCRSIRKKPLFASRRDGRVPSDTHFCFSEVLFP